MIERANQKVRLGERLTDHNPGGQFSYKKIFKLNVMDTKTKLLFAFSLYVRFLSMRVISNMFNY